MKKLNKLFAILIAVLGVQTLSAQTDVTDQYLTNAGFDDETSFVNNGVCTYAKDCSANGTTLSQMQSVNGWTFGVANGDARASGAYAWGATHFLGGNGYTIPSTDEEGNTAGGALGICAVWNADLYYYQEVTLKPGVYEFSYRVYNSGSGATAVDKNLFGFVADNGTSYYGATKTFTSNSWKTESMSFTLTTETKGRISVGIDAANAGSGGSHHLFVDYIKLTHKSFSDVTEANPVDLTSMVSNTKAAWTGATETPGYDGVTMVAVYKGSDWTGDALSQTINGLPAGNYRMEVYCQAHSSWDTDVAAEGATGYTYLCANEYKLDVPIRNADGATTKQLHTFEKISITNGSLKISVVNEKNAANWISVYVKSLTFLGPDKSLEEANFNNNVTALKALSTENLPAAFVTKINNLISSYGSADASGMTLSELVAANEEIKSVIDLHPIITTAFSSLKNLIQLCDTYASESYSNVQEEAQRTAFTTAIETASTNSNKATTEDLTEVFNALEAARQKFILVAIPTTGNSYDMTFLIENPSFETGDLTGWTVTASSDTGVKPNSNGTYTTTGVDGNYLFNTYWKGNPLTQEISDLPSGVYELKVLVASDGGTVYLTADDKHNEGTMTSDKTQFLEASIEFVCTDGNAVIGVVGGADGDAAEHKDFVADGYWWYKADNFRLYRSFDPSTAQNEVKDLKSSATALLSKPMNKEAKATFESKINSVDEKSDNPFELASMATMLNEAIAEAKVSITEYEKLKKYIDMTAVFTDVTSYTTKYNNGEYASTDVETTRQELNVMRFNAASHIFTNNIEVTGWEGTMGGKNTSSQHWDGTTTTKYYDNNSWNGTAHSTTTNITLPAGNYVLKAALRSSANTTLRLTVLDKTVDIEGKGDQGYGIDVNGKATFAEEGTYANEDKGRGWEWEFVKFELTEETIVTLTVECDYNGVYGWASFSDITLWMDDATYVTVYGKELDAPLAEAKTLVNTLPMGETENTALINAIAQGEGTIETPDQLNAAIDALKEAVANAKAWVVAYDEAKAPLVAALERFEADFNDGANGALRPMSDEAWNTLLTAVKTAAEAKDVNDTYKSFATDAETFNKAMNNAEPSIILYKKWAGLIVSVQAYYDNIKQDAALNTAISTASAESNKATDASLTSATEALNAAYQEALDGDFDASIFLGDNLDFESGTGTALDKYVFEIPGWDIEYDGNVNENARIQPGYYEEKEANTYAIRIRSNWEDAPTTMRVYKEVVLPSGSYNLSMTLLTSIAGSGVNLTYYELNGERTMLSSDTYKKVTAPSIELEEPTILLLSIGLTGTTGNNAQELYADNIALACNAKTLYQRTLENIKALAEDGEPTLVATNVYNEYKDKEGSLTAEQKTTAIAVINNAISIDAANNMVTSLIKNADFTGGTNSYSVQGSGGQVQAPKEWTFGYTFEGWNDTKVTDGYFNLWAGVIKYGELSQVINNLPNGTYKLTADVVTSSTDGSSIVAIYGAPANGNIARSKNADNSDDYLNYEVYFKVVDNQATIGARTDNHYFKLKNIQLEYVEDDAVAVDNGILYQAAFINRGKTTWDITEITPNASEASIYMSSPNALIIANEGQISNVNNVIVDGTAASLVLNDGGYAFNTTADFTATALNYAREFTKDTWLTVCLPFAYPIPENENVKVETLGAIDLDTKTFTFDEVTGTMEANTPYLIKNSTETAALFASLDDVEVKATPAAMNVTITADNSEHQGEFIGTYTTVKTDALMEDGTYDILFFGTDGQLYYLSQGITTKVVNIKPFRAYIRLPKGAINWSDGQQARVRHRNSEMTDIDTLESADDSQKTTVIYDMHGRRVTEMVKGGMYIVNGKKVIVK